MAHIRQDQRMPAVMKSKAKRGPGRPRHRPGELRDHVIQVSVSKREYDAFREYMAAKFHLAESLAAYAILIPALRAEGFLKDATPES